MPDRRFADSPAYAAIVARRRAARDPHTAGQPHRRDLDLDALMERWNPGGLIGVIAMELLEEAQNSLHAGEATRAEILCTRAQEWTMAGDAASTEGHAKLYIHACTQRRTDHSMAPTTH